jgi:hypothetical protein
MDILFIEGRVVLIMILEGLRDYFYIRQSDGKIDIHFYMRISYNTFYDIDSNLKFDRIFKDNIRDYKLGIIDL